MSRKVFASILGLFVLIVFAGFTPIQASPAFSTIRAELTPVGIVTAVRSGIKKGDLVAMQPQSDLALLKKATLIGPHSGSSTIELTVSLRLRNVSKLKGFLQDVQDPHSSVYHRFLSPSEFAARFGPTQTQVATVVQFLQRHGIAVKNISPNRILIHTDATTEAYEHAFKISINNYRLNGRSFFSTEDTPKLPASIEGLVRNVVGLDNAAVLHPMHHIRALEENNLQVAPGNANATVPPPPPATSSFYRPSQIATAYDWPSITDNGNGEGVTIAILTADSSNLPTSDYTGFWNVWGLPGHAVNIIHVDGDQGATDGTIETLLDMEWSGAMCPGAVLNVYMGSDPSLATFVDVYNRFVEDNTAQVMTVSWGAAESVWGSVAQTADEIFMQGAAQGISMFAAAGDNGSSDGTGQDNMADFPSSSLYVSAANGTELQADKDGNYISETAWSDTGGAISEIFSQPSWQTGPGVPQNGWLNNSDISLNAGGAWPDLLLYQNSWYLVWGTSAVAPQLAALFAIGVSKNGRIGQSNSAIYNDVNANDSNYASDFHDVTTGSNGAYQAGPDWDHPTGWGSPRATSLLSHLGVEGPHGVLQGTVTDASNGKPIANAEVLISPGHYSRVTNSNGSYKFVLPAGDYTATVTHFGYEPGTASVTVSDGGSTTQGFTLNASPRAKLSGKVTDGSGHGYGLYAEIKVTTPGAYGPVADIWTDPTTGAYSLKLPEGNDYTLDVIPAFDGYDSGTASISLNSAVTQDFALKISSTCTAPGYGFTKGFGEDFNGSVFPPDGWSVNTPVNNGYTIWQLNTQFGDNNYTSGSGTAAEANSDHAGSGQGPYDTRLVTPPIPVTSLPADPTLRYLFKYQHEYGADDAFDLGISTDGGNNWTKILSADDCGSPYQLPGCRQQVDLGPYVPASGDIMLRWRYYDLSQSAWDWYAQLDDVAIGTCKLVAGGLVYGQVTDANTGDALVRATVSDNRGDKAETVENASDSNLPVGAYLMFAPSGDRTITASGAGYQDASADISMADNAVVTQDFDLNAGRVGGTPGQFDVHVPVNGSLSKTITLTNSGTAPAHYRIVEANPPLPASSDAAQSIGLVQNVGHDSEKAFRPAIVSRCSGGIASCARLEAAVSAPAAGTGSVVGSFDTSLPGTYGLGVDRNAGNLWVGSISASGSGGDNHDYRFLFDGTAATGDGIDVSGLDNSGFAGDMAFDDNTGMLWQIAGSANQSCIYELNPATREVTGKKICPNTGIFEYALAYDPSTDTWYTGDFTTQNIYHFDASGKLLGTKYVKINVIGLAYNSSTKHLFVLASDDKHSIYVLDTQNDYQQVASFDVPGLAGGGGAGLDYDCDGNLWATDVIHGKVYEIRSGEGGWCASRSIPWLTETPASGTIAPGASIQVKLDFDGSGQTASTTSKSQIMVQSATPYGDGVLAVPLTVAWDPPANNPPVASDGSLTTNENQAASGTLEATDSDGDPLTFSIVSQPSHGSVSISDASTGAYTYTPDKNYSGSDSFTFKANDGQADSNVATVSVTIKAVSPPPSGGGGGGGLGFCSLLALLVLLTFIQFRRRIGSAGSATGGGSSAPATMRIHSKS